MPILFLRLCSLLLRPAAFAALATLVAISPALANCDLPEPEMRTAALEAADLAPIDAYLACHQYSDFGPSVRDHRRKVASEMAYASATTIDDLRDFVLRYPDSPAIPEALARINQINTAVTYLPFPNSVLSGTSAGESLLENVGQCASACTANGNCQGYTFSTNGMCNLFASVTGRTPRGNVVSGALSEPPLAGVSQGSAPLSEASFMVRQGLFVSGLTLGQFPSGSLPACQSECAAMGQCVTFVYEIATGQCALRSSVATSRPDPAYVSGMKSPGDAGGLSIPQSPASSGFDIFNNVDLENPRNSPWDYAILRRTSADRCQQLCAADNRCQAFTHNGDVNACILKSDFTRAVTFPGATSGQKR